MLEFARGIGLGGRTPLELGGARRLPAAAGRPPLADALGSSAARRRVAPRGSDGSHAGTEFEPMAFTLEATKRVALCNCKRTGNPPFCDGSHKHVNAGTDQ